MSSHRKIYSQGSIPFSWEDKPGISKVIANQECLEHNNKSLQALDLKPPSLRPPPNLLSNSPKVVDADNYEMMIKIPLPPCPSQPPRRSTSSKDLKWQDDPFLVAYKECTKTINIDGKLSSSTTTTHDHECWVKKGSVVGSKLRKTKFMFSCKSSCDTREDNFIKLSKLPPLPGNKIQSLW